MDDNFSDKGKNEKIAGGKQKKKNKWASVIKNTKDNIDNSFLDAQEYIDKYSSNVTKLLETE